MMAVLNLSVIISGSAPGSLISTFCLHRFVNSLEAAVLEIINFFFVRHRQKLLSVRFPMLHDYLPVLRFSYHRCPLHEDESWLYDDQDSFGGCRTV